MSARSPRVRIVIADRGWILERMAREIADRLEDVDVDTATSPSARLHYYMNYSAWQGRVSEVEAAYFTHIEERDAPATERFFHAARHMDVSVCMAERYAQQLRSDGVSDVRLIVPGVDLERFQPKLRVGVVGRNYHTGRKGADLVQAVLDVPGVEWAFAGEGWPGSTTRIPDEELPAFYRSLDHLLVPAYYEGGPMPALEAIACGTSVLSGDVGFMPKFPHIPFPVGNADALRQILVDLVAAKRDAAQAAAPYTWDAWADQHGQLFDELLSARPKSDQGKPMANQAPTIPAVPNRPLRVLFSLGESEGEQRGGPSVRVRRTAEALRGQGHDVELWSSGQAPQGPFDLVHGFNVWPAEDSLQRLKTLREYKAPVFFSPIFMDHGEWEWSWPILLEVCGLEGYTRRLTRVIKRRASMPPAERRIAESFTTAFHQDVVRMTELADHLVCLSAHELESLRSLGVDTSKAFLVRNGIDCSPFDSPDRKAFKKAHKLRRYVLCVGRVEHRKNQALLVHALRHTLLQIALAGDALVPEYEQLVQQLATGRTRMIGRVEAESPMLASAYAGAAAFVLPSWCEGAPISALEAAACGTPLVLSDRSGEREYFGQLAEYCDPANPTSIRQAVRRAIRGDNKRKRDRLRTLVRDKYTIDATARVLEAAYLRVLQRTNGAGPANDRRPRSSAQ